MFWGKKKEPDRKMIKIEMECPRCGEMKVYHFDVDDLSDLESFCINCGWSAKNYDWNKSSIFS